MKKQKGITLIALIITIIVLLILVGVALIAITGDNGILGKADKATIATAKMSAKEQVQLAVNGSYEDDGKIDNNTLKDNLNSIAGIKNVPDTISTLPITVNLDGYDITIKENGVVVFKDETTGDNGEKPGEGNVEEEPESVYVARIGENQYESLTSALNTITPDSANVEVVLLKSTRENITIAQNTNVTLNLNNYTLNSNGDSNNITVNGTVLIKDGTVKGIYTSKVATINIAKTGICNIENAHIDRESEDSVSWETIQLYGTININSGSVNSPNSNAICTYTLDSGNTIITINGGEITSSNARTIDNNTSGKLYIYEGAKISAISKSSNTPTVQNRGYAEVNGGEIISDKGIAILNYGGDMLINDGIITSTDSIAMYNTVNGTLTVNNATVTSTNYIASYNIDRATTIINNVTMYAKNYAVYSEDAKVTIKAGTINKLENSSNTFLLYSYYGEQLRISSKVILNGGDTYQVEIID